MSSINRDPLIIVIDWSALFFNVVVLVVVAAVAVAVAVVTNVVWIRLSRKISNSVGK